MSTAKLFVTNNARIAKIFNDSNSRVFSEVYSKIETNLLDDTLLNPERNRSWARFDSFEYTLGYGQGAGENNFKISLTLRDLYGDLERRFLTNFIDSDIDLSQADQEQLEQLAQDSILTGDIDPDTAFVRRSGSTTPTRNSNPNILSVVNRTFYFIFISDTGYYLSPIVSNFFKASFTAATATQLFKLIKLEFICIGHPFLISQLAEITNYKSNQVYTNPNKQQTSQKHTITLNWSLRELNDNLDKLDAHIKNALRILFKEITGKQIILLLPDFGKLFKRYKENRLSSIQKSMQSDNINSDFINSLNVQNAANYWELKSFLKEIGFNFFPDFVSKFYEKLNQLSFREKRILEEYRNKFKEFYDNYVNNLIDQLVKTFDAGSLPITELLNNIDIYNRLKRDRGQASGVFEVSNDDFFNALDILKQSDIFKRNFDSGQIYTLGEAIKSRDIRLANQILINEKILSGDDALKDILKSLIKIIYFSKLDKIINLENTGYINYLIQSGKSVNDVEFTPSYNEATDSYSGDVEFIISSEDLDHTGTTPKTNFVNFNVFANNFSNRLSYVSDQTYEISYSEENTGNRLNIIKDTCFYLDNDLQRVSFLSNSNSQAVVIFDSWFFNNLYAPVQGVPNKIDDNFISISEIDKKNFAGNSEYHKRSFSDLKKNYYSYNGIMLPFAGLIKNVNNVKDESEFISNEIIQYFPDASSVFSTDTDTKYEIPIFVWYPAGEDFLKQLNQVRTQIIGIDASATEERTNAKLKTNLDYINVEANSLNHLAAYNSYVNEVASILTDDALIESRLSIYKRFNFNLTEFERLFSTFFAALADPDPSNDPSPQQFLSDVKKRIDEFLGTIKIEDYARVFPDSEERKLLDKSRTISDPFRDIERTLNRRLDSYKEKLKIRILKDLWYTSLKTDPNGTKVTNLTRSFLGNPLVSKANMLKHLYNKYYTIKITSVFPWFQLNNIKVLNTPCLLLIFDSIKTNLTDVDSVIIPSPLSGFYNIVGFKHILTTTGSKVAYSEFVLRKNLDFGSTS